MKPLVAISLELVGLFIDDGSLTLAILASIVLAGTYVHLLPGSPFIGGLVLLLGCLGLLLENVLRARRTYHARARTVRSPVEGIGADVLE